MSNMTAALVPTTAHSKGMMDSHFSTLPCPRRNIPTVNMVVALGAGADRGDTGEQRHRRRSPWRCTLIKVRGKSAIVN